MATQWYVAKTKPRAERVLAEFFSRWQVENYLPEILRPGSTRRGAEYLFPSYIFCRLDPASPVWPIVRWAPGISYFLGGDAGPTAIPGAVITTTRQLVQDWNSGGYQAPFRKGEAVKVATGPLAGIEGVFQRQIPARERCQILVELVGRLVSVEVPTTDMYNPGPTALGLPAAS